MRISDWSSDVCSSDLSLLERPEGIGPPGTRIVGTWPKRSAPISRPGTILSQMPSSNAPSNIPWESAIAVPIAMVSREKSDRRSEEHTSELQSLMRISYAVFCLKKKKKKQQI